MVVLNFLAKKLTVLAKGLHLDFWSGSFTLVKYDNISQTLN